MQRVSRLAGALRELGIGPNQRVAILAKNSDRYHELLYAVPWAGAVVVPLNTRWSAAEVSYALVESEAQGLVVDETGAQLLREITPHTPNVRSVVYCGETQGSRGSIDYESLISGANSSADAGRGGNDLYGLFYTGGTTGHPKGVMLSRDNLLVAALGTLATHPIITRGGRLPPAAPMFHLADFWMWLAGNQAGTTHVMIPGFDPRGVLQAIQQHRVSDMLLVPTMIQLLVDEPARTDHDLTSIRNIIYGVWAISEGVLAARPPRSKKPRSPRPMA